MFVRFGDVCFANLVYCNILAKEKKDKKNKEKTKNNSALNTIAVER